MDLCKHKIKTPSATISPDWNAHAFTKLHKKKAPESPRKPNERRSSKNHIYTNEINQNPSQD